MTRPGRQTPAPVAADGHVAAIVQGLRRINQALEEYSREVYRA
jgi:hypothetical protein